VIEVGLDPAENGEPGTGDSSPVGLSIANPDTLFPELFTTLSLYDYYL
jgi:hypothetical protein